MRKWLTELRESKGLTQVQLANAIGATSNTVSQWECGRRNPSRAFRQRLSKILGSAAASGFNAEEV